MIATTSSASSAGARPDPAPPRGGGRAGGSAGPRRSPRRRHRHAGRPALGCPARRLLLGNKHPAQLATPITQTPPADLAKSARRRTAADLLVPGAVRHRGDPAFDVMLDYIDPDCVGRFRRPIVLIYRGIRAARVLPMTEQEGKRGAGRERSGAAARNGPALCRGFSRLVWDVGVGAQRKAAL
jgi:hypothetical protein